MRYSLTIFFVITLGACSTQKIIGKGIINHYNLEKIEDDYFLKIVDKKKHADWFLDAEEAKKHNLANQIRLPTMTIDVDVNIEVE